MKRVIYLLLLVAFIGCSKDNSAVDEPAQTELAGKWVRVEQWINPGNGGSWRPTNDNPPVFLELRADGRVISNHSTYSQFTDYEKVAADSIAFLGMEPQVRRHSFSIKDGVLTIQYLCDEGCGDRFVKDSQGK